MTPQDPLRPAELSSPLSSPQSLPLSSPLSSPLASLLSAGWRGQAMLLACGVLGGELILRALPGEGWGLMGLAGIAAGWWWLGRRPARLAAAKLPSSFEAWLGRCDDLLLQFEQLEGDSGEGLARRRKGLETLREEGARSSLHLALVGSVAPDATWAPQLQRALRGRQALSLRWGEALPAVSRERRWPDGLAAADVVLFHLVTPLRAADLRWLEAVPAGQPVWLLVQPDAPCDPQALAAELVSQWPAAAPERVLPWDGRPEALTTSLQPLAGWLTSEAAALRRSTPLRRSEQLHRHWQAELERLRRQRLLLLQQRTQWLVAAGVFAAPLPSVDLVVLAAANGLMLQEMARLWDCPWSVEQLKAAAVELAKVSLLLGVVEWSSQALVAAVRLHGATWLVGGALQALSAAYLTRVVSHAMADVLALSVGVEAPDLERIKREAPLLVARAAEAEKLDWPGFLQQGRDWIGQQLMSPGNGTLPAPASTN